MGEKLSSKECVPCKGGTPPLKPEKQQELLAQLEDGWEVVDEHHLHRDFEFDDFVGALDFVNRIGEIAEEEQHHPDIYLTYGEVGITLLTHKIDGLSESDFIMAAKIDELD